MAIFNAYLNSCHNSVMGIDPQPELLTSLKNNLDNNIRASILSQLWQAPLQPIKPCIL